MTYLKNTMWLGELFSGFHNIWWVFVFCSLELFCPIHERRFSMSAAMTTPLDSIAGPLDLAAVAFLSLAGLFVSAVLIRLGVDFASID